MRRRSELVIIFTVVIIVGILILFVPVVPVYGNVAVSGSRAYLNKGYISSPNSTFVQCTSYNPSIDCDQLYFSVSYWLVHFGEVSQSGSGGGYVWSPIWNR